MNVAIVMAALAATTASVHYLRAHDVRSALRAELHRVGDTHQLVVETRRADAALRAGRRSGRSGA